MATQRHLVVANNDGDGRAGHYKRTNAWESVGKAGRGRARGVYEQRRGGFTRDMVVLIVK